MPASQTPGLAIQVQGLKKSFNELEVLRGVDLDVARGSIFALLGSNCAGKTTFVKILSTLLKADAGTAASMASTSQRTPATRAGVDQPDRAVRGGGRGPQRAGEPGADGAVAAPPGPGRLPTTCFERFALTDAAARKVATYSGGMRRRLDIAMSLIGDPPVIFLDEPTTGLDPEARMEVWESVKRLADSGTTVLLTTQHLDEAEQLADRIAILHRGRIIANGTLAELKRLLPPSGAEYVEKQPTLEDVFLALVGGGRTMSRHFLEDTPS